MSLLTVVQEFCSRTALPLPETAIDNPDNQILQIVALCNEVCEELVSRQQWQGITRQATFTTVADEDQGVITDLADVGWQRSLNETFYNRTLRLPVYGPMTAEQWQALKALPSTGPFYKYRYRQNHILFNPPPPAGHECAFEYISRAIISYTYTPVDSDPITVYQTYFQHDDDEFILGEALLMAGIRWKFKAEKNLEYGEDFARYERMVAQAFAADGTKPQLSMDKTVTDWRPGIFVPSGNWNV